MAAVEFALVLPILVLIVMGIVEYGLIFSRQHVITNAAREGARAGIVESTDALAEAAARAGAEFYLQQAGLTGATVNASSPAVGGFTAVQVDITLPWQALTFVPVPAQIQARAVMRRN